MLQLQVELTHECDTANQLLYLFFPYTCYCILRTQSTRSASRSDRAVRDNRIFSNVKSSNVCGTLQCYSPHCNSALYCELQLTGEPITFTMNRHIYLRRGRPPPYNSHECLQKGCLRMYTGYTMLLFEPTYRLSHPENYLF